MTAENIPEDERLGWFVRGKLMNEFYIWMGKSGYVQGWQEWREWFSGDYNWQNFTLIEASFENGGHMGNRTIELGLLGLRMRILWTHDNDAEGRQIVEERMAELLVHPECAVELDEILKAPKDHE
jgi:hypothetical protein